jgi:hypothetical protein
VKGQIHGVIRFFAGGWRRCRRTLAEPEISGLAALRTERTLQNAPIREVFVLRETAIAATLALTAWITGCSGGDPTSGQPTTAPSLPNEPVTSGGGTTTSGSNGGTSSSSSGGSPSVDACISACEAQHPTAAAKGRAIDQCWAQSCSTSCDGIGTGQDFGPTKGSCQTDVKTPSAECSTCTVQHCCTAWDACFSDADCVALNACSVACYK